MASFSTSCKLRADKLVGSESGLEAYPVSIPELQESDVQVNRSVVPREITEEYIAGLVQADGSFSAVLARKTRKDKEYFNLSLVFTLVQSQKYKEVILDVQKKWGNIGHWYVNKKDNSIRYQITKQSDLLNVVIPFFMKHQLRSGKLLSFLHFRFIVETMASKAHVGNKNVFLSLVVIASNMNPLGKLGNKIRYLKPEQQYYVINNIQPEGVDISKLTDSIKNFKSNPLTLDFLHGLFDGDGSLSVYVKSLSQEGKNFKLSMGYTFTIVQDIHNFSLLQEIKSYFNDVGNIYDLTNNCQIYKVGSRSDLISKILPIMTNKSSIELVTDPYEGLPLMKHNKLYYCCKILDILSKRSGVLMNEESVDEILRLSYHITKDFEISNIDKYVEDLKQRLISK